MTMKWWDDLWLNEGFASTLMYFAMDHVNPDWRVVSGGYLKLKSPTYRFFLFDLILYANFCVSLRYLIN